MHQVVCDVNSVEGGSERVGRECVGLHQFDAGPTARLEDGATASRRPHRQAACCEAGHEVSADVAGCAKYEDSVHMRFACRPEDYHSIERPW